MTDHTHARTCIEMHDTHAGKSGGSMVAMHGTVPYNRGMGVFSPDYRLTIMPDTRECPQCCTSFPPSRTWQTFCSPHCRNLYHSEARKTGAENRQQAEALADKVLQLQLEVRNWRIQAENAADLLDRYKQRFGGLR